MKWSVVVTMPKEVSKDMLFGSYVLDYFKTKREAQDAADFHNGFFPDHKAEVRRVGKEVV